MCNKNCVWLTIKGNYGFAEFRNPEEATRAMDALGSVALMGQTLKVGRPSQYIKSGNEQQNGGTL